jgi:hypothetical protein
MDDTLPLGIRRIHSGERGFAFNGDSDGLHETFERNGMRDDTVDRAFANIE